jgi:upstream activation factor subunit UAF30
VTSEELERYTAIIDDILETSDLETISRKKIRQGLENALGGQDLSEQKVCKINTTGVVLLYPHIMA